MMRETGEVKERTELGKMIASLRAKHAEAGETLEKLERSIALRELHPEITKHTGYRTHWKQTNASSMYPKYVLIVQIRDEITEHNPEDVLEALLRTMPNYTQYKRKRERMEAKDE